MAEGGKDFFSRGRSRQSRRRSKSASYGRNSEPFELTLPVSLEEKKEVLKKKKPKHLINEYIALDVDKNKIKKNLDEEKEENRISKREISLMQENEVKHKREIAKLNETIESLKKEIKNIQADFDREKNKLIEENASLGEKFKEKKNEMKSRYEAEISKLKEEKRKETEELTKERKENCRFVQRLFELLEGSRANVYITGSSNVQFGESNIIKTYLMEQWKELTDKLPSSVDDLIDKRKELELKVHSIEILLKEIQDSVNKVLKNLDKTTSKRLGKDKDLLEMLVSDRSDERVLTDGIKQLKKHRSRKNMHLDAEAAVVRLLNKFDGLTCGEFVDILEGKTHKSDQGNAHEGNESIQVSEHDMEAPLDRNLCINILAQWLQLSEDNDADQLLVRIKVYESKLSAEMILKYREETCSRSSDRSDDLYSNLPRSQNLRGLPDALSQFMHQLEGLKIVIDIDKKVDGIIEALKSKDATATHIYQRNISQESRSSSNLHFSDV